MAHEFEIYVEVQQAIEVEVEFIGPSVVIGDPECTIELVPPPTFGPSSATYTDGQQVGSVSVLVNAENSLSDEIATTPTYYFGLGEGLDSSLVIPDTIVPFSLVDTASNIITSGVESVPSVSSYPGINMVAPDGNVIIQLKDSGGNNLGIPVAQSVKSNGSESLDIVAPDAIVTDGQDNELAALRSGSRVNIEQIFEERMEDIFKPENYGGNGDGVPLYDIAVTGATITSASAPFLLGRDEGKIITVLGPTWRHNATIISVQSTTSVTISAAAPSNVTGRKGFFGTDNLTPIMSAAQAAYDNGGGIVKFGRGIYCIGEALNATTKTQIYLPDSDGYGENIVVEFVGVTSPHYRGPGVADPNLSGSTIVSLCKGSATGIPAVFGYTEPAGGNLLGFTWTMPVVKSINIILLPVGPAIVMGGINLKKSALHRVEDCKGTVWGEPLANLNEPASNIYGMYLAPTNCTPSVYASGNDFRGFYYGMRAGEHLKGGGNFFRYCVTAVALEKAYHFNQLAWFGVYHSKHAIECLNEGIGQQASFTGELSWESKVYGGRWYDSEELIKDPLNLGVSRHCIVQQVIGDVGIDNATPVSKIGGTGIQSFNNSEHEYIFVASDPTQLIYSNTFTALNGGTPTGSGITNTGTRAQIQVSGVIGSVAPYARQIAYDPYTFGTRRFTVACEMYTQSNLTTADCDPRWELSNLAANHKLIITRQTTATNMQKYRIIMVDTNVTIYDSASVLSVNGGTFTKTRITVDPVSLTAACEYWNGTAWAALGLTQAISPAFAAATFTPYIMNKNATTAGTLNATFDNLFITRGDLYTTSEP